MARERGLLRLTSYVILSWLCVDVRAIRAEKLMRSSLSKYENMPSNDRSRYGITRCMYHTLTKHENVNAKEAFLYGALL